MRVMVSKSKNAEIYYIIESYRKKDGKTSSRIIERIGSKKELLDKGISDPKAYAEQRLEEFQKSLSDNLLDLNLQIDFKEQLDASTCIETESTAKNIGFLYLSKLFDNLKLSDFFNSIKTKAKFNIEELTKYLAIDRILNPGSKRQSFDNRKKYISYPDCELYDLYRVLDQLNKNDVDLQKSLFEGTEKLISLNTDVLYYDCTNFYFECETEDDNIYSEDGDIIQWGLRRYGASKEHRPNPIVQMGLFTDKNGIPMSYCIHHGSNNEQNTVIPLETQMIKNYDQERFIYCSDGGLGSFDNRFFNTIQGRNYVVTQSLKKTEQEELEYMFKDSNWFYLDNSKVSLDKFKEILDKKFEGKELTEEEEEYISKDMIYKKYPMKRKVSDSFFKKMHMRTIKNVYSEETIFITFSAKYYLYQKNIFERQLNDAKEWIKKGIDDIKKGNNDIRRFIKSTSVTKEGEVAEQKVYEIDEDVINKEKRFHGFYAVATSLENTSIQDILEINASRWRIEESFRIMKSEFDSRPVYVSTEEHIRGHFAICYISLLLYRILERKLYLLNPKENKFSVKQIISTLRNMNIVKEKEVYYKAIYTNSKVLQELEKLYKLELDKAYYKIKKFTELTR